MSHASNPAETKADSISLSPLLPSWRRTATLCFLAALMTASFVGSGSYISFHSGDLRSFSPASSCVTHSGFRCRCSRRKLVSSQRSRSKVVFSSMQGGLAPTAILIFELLLPSSFHDAANAVPISMHDTPFDRNASMTLCVSSLETSRTMPASSLKSVPTSPAPSQVSGTTTSIEQFPAKAISIRVTASPPSDRSCPARIAPCPIDSWTARKAPFSFPKSSRSGLSFPIWPYTCASDEPPVRALPPPRSTKSRFVLSLHLVGHLRSGVTVWVTSGQVT
mmetsp:Transcript_28549/g.60529  ORF Transcript_28549/g.60529 Transcript_28549/m.60529 type:complete len:278 (-) Transcript_28549:2593-3426(-)